MPKSKRELIDQDKNQFEKLKLIKEIHISYPSYKPKIQLSAKSLVNRIRTKPTASQILQKLQDEQKNQEEEEESEESEESEDDLLIIEPPVLPPQESKENEFEHFQAENNEKDILENINFNYYVSESDETISSDEESKQLFKDIELEEKIEEQEINQIIKSIIKGGWRKKYLENHLNVDEQKELEAPSLFQNSKKATEVVEIDFEDFFQKQENNLEKDDEAEEERAYKAKILRKSFRIELENSQNSSEPIIFENSNPENLLEKIQKTNILTLENNNSKISKPVRRHKLRSSFISKNFERPDAHHVSSSCGFQTK